MEIKLALLFALLFTQTAAWASDSFSVTNPLVREAPPGMMMTAGYAEWTNNTSKEIIVTGASSATYKMVEIHLSTIENGIAKMSPQESLAIPANGSVILEPGGLHLMLMGAKKAVKAGDKIDITMHTSAGDKTVTFTVKRF